LVDVSVLSLRHNDFTAGQQCDQEDNESFPTAGISVYCKSGKVHVNSTVNHLLYKHWLN